MYTKEQVEQLPDFESAIKSIDLKISNLEKEKEHIAIMVENLKRITEFYNGVPIEVMDLYKPNVKIYLVPDTGRAASVYHNVTVPKDVDDFGIYIFDSPIHGNTGRERCLHHTGVTYEDALKIAKKWVANGEVP